MSDWGTQEESTSRESGKSLAKAWSRVESRATMFVGSFALRSAVAPIGAVFG